MKNKVLSVIALIALLPPAVFAESKTEKKVEAPPPPRVTYYGRTIAQTMHWKGAEWLLRQEREREESTQLMIKNLGIKKGQVLCDLGSGNGYHSLMMAKLTGPEGKVHAVDIQPEMLTMLKARAKKEGIENIETILGEFHDPHLPENTMDLVLIADAYHEFSHPELMLQAIRRSLKPDGRLALLEFRMEDPKVPIKLLHKMSKKQMLKELAPNGFKLVEEFDELPWQHLVFFGRAPIPEKEEKP